MPSIRNTYYRTALFLAIITIAYNLLEGVVSVLFGINDESLTLFGFGADSFIEVISGTGILLMVIRLATHGEGIRSKAEKMALRITGTAFWLLSLSLIVTAGYSAYTSHKPETTIWGIVISLISIASMSVLMGLKMKTGRRLGSEAIIADARCTLICIYMSLVLLGSSLLFELTGLGWFDILGSAGLAWFSFSEGKECFEKARKDHHCSCH